VAVVRLMNLLKSHCDEFACPPDYCLPSVNAASASEKVRSNSYPYENPATRIFPNDFDRPYLYCRFVVKREAAAGGFRPLLKIMEVTKSAKSFE